MKSQKSHIPKVKVARQWIEVDASSDSMGRVATKIANLLRGKLKRDFVHHLDNGDFVVATNIDKMKFTGNKIAQKKYYHYSGYPGGLREKSLKDMIVDQPDKVLRAAVFSMIDDNKLRKLQMRRLRMVLGTEHEFKVDKKA